MKRDGTLMALEAETILDSGSISGAVLTMSAVFLGSLYKWPSFDVKGFEVLTHKPSVAAYRAPTAPQTIFALDSHMEEIARPARSRPGRVPAPAPHARGRSDGQRPALAEQRGEGGAAPPCRAPALEEPQGVGEERRRTATGCAARASRSAAGSPGSSRPAPPSGSTPTDRCRSSPARSTSPARTSGWRRSPRPPSGWTSTRSASSPATPTARRSPGSARAARRSTRSAPR